MRSGYYGFRVQEGNFPDTWLPRPCESWRRTILSVPWTVQYTFCRAPGAKSPSGPFHIALSTAVPPLHAQGASAQHMLQDGARKMGSEAQLLQPFEMWMCVVLRLDYPRQLEHVPSLSLVAALLSGPLWIVSSPAAPPLHAQDASDRSTLQDSA